MLKNKIKKIIENKNISIKQLAQEIDTNYSTVQKIVNINFLDNCSIGDLTKIANFIDVDLNDLFYELRICVERHIYKNDIYIEDYSDHCIGHAANIDEVKKMIEVDSHIYKEYNSPTNSNDKMKLEYKTYIEIRTDNEWVLLSDTDYEFNKDDFILKHSVSKNILI